MVNVSVARRYARALIDVAGPNADKVLAQLTSFVDAMRASGELAAVLSNPAYSRAQRMGIVEAMMKQIGVEDEGVGNFFRLLVERHRVNYLPDILRLFRDQADVKAGRVRGRLISARPIAKDQVDRIEKQLEKITQRNVVLEPRVDPTVLGGVAAQVGSVEYDGTLRTQLNELRRNLKSR